MSMCESPISASDRTVAAIDRLWRVSRLETAGEQLRLLDDMALSADNSLTQAVMLAVGGHLRARALLGLKDFDAAHAAAGVALLAWKLVLAELAAIDPQMVARAHAFHARLANRHQTAYRDFARKQLLDLAHCARLKTQSISAAIKAGQGDFRHAADALNTLALFWRTNLPVRLPGLREMELAAAAWFRDSGNRERAVVLRERARSVSGGFSAYPEDAPEAWPKHPSQEELLRFAFAAARLPDQMRVSRMGVEETSGGEVSY